MVRDKTTRLLAAALVLAAMSSPALANRLRLPDSAVGTGWEPHGFCYGFEAPGPGVLVNALSFWRPCWATN